MCLGLGLKIKLKTRMGQVFVVVAVVVIGRTIPDGYTENSILIIDDSCFFCFF